MKKIVFAFAFLFLMTYSASAQSGDNTVPSADPSTMFLKNESKYDFDVPPKKQKEKVKKKS